MNIRNWLQVTEILTVFGSAIGTIVAAVTQQAIYATTPLALAFSLNLFNRQELERRNRRIDRDLIQQTQQLSQRMQFVEEQFSRRAIASAELNRTAQTLDNHAREMIELKQSVSALTTLQAQLTQVDDTVKTLMAQLDELVRQFEDRPELEESYLHDYIIRFKREVENKLIDLDERTEVLLERQD